MRRPKKLDKPRSFDYNHLTDVEWRNLYFWLKDNDVCFALDGRGQIWFYDDVGLDMFLELKKAKNSTRAA